MADHVFDHVEVTAAYRYAAQWYRSVVGAVTDEQWEQPALGEWSARELVAHTARAFRTVVEYAQGDPKDPTPIATAADYFRIVLAEETPHVHIAARARADAATEAGWVVAVDRLVAEALAVVDRSHKSTPMHLFVGEMPLDQYLATRVVEVVVHGIDLATVLAIPTSPPPEAVRVTLLVLADLAGADHRVAVIRHLTGRSGSLAAVNVLDAPLP